MKIYFGFALFLYSFCSSGEDFRVEVNDAGKKYVYETVWVEGEIGVQEKRGKISVSGSDGDILDIHTSVRLPGCYKDFPAISVIEMNVTNFPFSDKFHSEKFVFFCGNSDGRHHVLLVYQPFRGFVDSLDFLLGPVNIMPDQNGVYRAKVNYEIVVGAIQRQVFYPVFYKLVPVGMSVGFTDKIDSTSYEGYRQVVEESIKAFQAEKNKYDAARALISANISGSESLYCKTKKTLVDLSEGNSLLPMVHEIESRFNSISCKGE